MGQITIDTVGRISLIKVNVLTRLLFLSQTILIWKIDVLFTQWQKIYLNFMEGERTS